MATTQHVQELRRGNRARPIPARKPARRGGRAAQDRRAITESRGGR